LLAVSTVRQIAVWNDPVSLWTHVIAHAPDSPRGYYNLGNHYLAGGDVARAEAEWRRAVEVQPNHSMALNQLGNVAMQASRLDEAATLYARAVRADGRNVEARYNLAVTLETLGRGAEARTHYEAFLEYAPAEYEHLIPAVRRKLGLTE